MWRSLLYGLLKLCCMSILLPCVGFAKNQVLERRNRARSLIITYSIYFQWCFLWVDKWENMFLRRTKSAEVLQEAPRQADLIVYHRMKCSIFTEQTFYHQAAVWENCGSWAVSLMSKLGNYRSLWVLSVCEVRDKVVKPISKGLSLCGWMQ